MTSTGPGAGVLPVAARGPAPGPSDGSGGGVHARPRVPGDLLRFGAVLLEFALIVGALKALNLETPALETVAVLALGGFVVHHALPRAWKLPFFALLSVASVALVLGGGAGTSLVAAGLLLIGACHLPVRWGARIAVLLGLGAAFAVLRLAPGGMPAWTRSLFPGAIWPILGSMFMFRLLIYVHDLRHRTAPGGFWRALAYFFMLPNVCCPLFPVVDYQTLYRNHYNDDPIHIYQVGAKWMLRGLAQLLVYRFVYIRCMIAPGEAHTALDVGQYMLTTFLLYIKISGLFHLVIGMLHMFGFNLPETHHLYLLSSSFTDFWRRINIFWKDFITKLVFYPLYFRWKRGGDARAVVLATLIAFLATWLLHSYQWFWIRGTFPVVWADLVFWFGLGIVVVLNVRWEQRRGRRRILKHVPRTFRSEAGLVLRIAGTFTAITILWTIWSTPDVAEIRVLLRALSTVDLRQGAILVAVPLLIGLAGLLLGGRQREHTEGTRSRAATRPPAFWPSAAGVAAGAAALLLVAERPSVLMFEPRLAAAADELRHRGLNQLDTAALHRGYYEELGDVARFDNELWKMYGTTPKDWGKEIDALEDRRDEIAYAFFPNLRGTWYGARFSTNSAGLRDQEYAAAKPPGVFRIGLIGASNDAGSGVNDGETYEAVAESLLNHAPPGAGGFEILNFSASGYGPLQKLAVTEMLMPAYQPDMILWAATRNELLWTFLKTENLVRIGRLAKYPYLADALRAAGMDSTNVKAQNELEHLLAPQAPAVLQQTLERFAASARAMHAEPVLLLVELPADKHRPATFDELVRIGRAAGIPVIDLHGAFAAVQDRSSLWVAPWDDHCNAVAHRMLGEALVRDLKTLGVAGRAPAGVEASGN